MPKLIIQPAYQETTEDRRRRMPNYNNKPEGKQ